MTERVEARSGMLDSAGMESGSHEYNVVRDHYLFSGLEEAEYAALSTHVTIARLEKGEVLFHRGDSAEYFYFVVSGQIELSLISPTGEMKVLEVLGPHRVFAEAVAFMKKKNYPVTAEALVNTVLCQISSAAYVNILHTNPDASMRLISDVCRQLHARVSEIERLTVQNARSRLASYLLDHVQESNDDEATIRLELPRHVIASRLSMQPETLSRLFRSMADEGIITVEDRIIFVHSLPRLRPYN
jgi:CRP-like cAMP-binding protein